MQAISRATATLSGLLAPWVILAEEVQPPLAAQPPSWYGPMWHGGWGFWWIFPLFMCLLMAVCVVGALLAWRSRAGAPPCGRGHAGRRACGCTADPDSAPRIQHERFTAEGNGGDSRAARQAPEPPAGGSSRS